MKPGKIIHLTQLDKGYSLRVEWNGKYQEFKTYEELEKALREEFGE